jgi:hypothetical protein
LLKMLLHRKCPCKLLTSLIHHDSCYCFCCLSYLVAFCVCDRYDKFCPFYKSVWMMRNIIHFYNLANQVWWPMESNSYFRIRKNPSKFRHVGGSSRQCCIASLLSFTHIFYELFSSLCFAFFVITRPRGVITST